jgi:uncharacterized protein (DUF58 family)
MRGKLGILAASGVGLLAALVSGSILIYFLLYLAAATVVAAYVVARRGLDGLEAGSWLDRQHATVGDTLSLTYTLRSRTRLPKAWLEVYSPSTLPSSIPGRVVALAPHQERTWAARVQLPERGQFRIDPLVVRTGDPFGLFESVASVGPSSNVIVYPQVAALPDWHLPPATIEASATRATSGFHLTPVVTSVRPYTPGDAFNRIHWRSSARHQELQVKEFDIEPSADMWLFVDLLRDAHLGAGRQSTLETAVSVTAALAGHALADGRGVGLEAVGVRRAVIAADRGARQRHKILGLLAVVQAEGTTPLAEVLLEGARRVRRGMVAIAVTPSLDPAWVRPLAALRGVGARPVACVIDPVSHLAAARAAQGAPEAPPSMREPLERETRALLHTLAEHDVQSHLLQPDRPLAEQLTSLRHPAPARPL